MGNSIEHDCSFEQDGFWFRYRAAAIIIEDGCVLVAYNNVDDYYYSIGGGVHLGETSEEAVIREVKEETGIAYEVDRLVFVNECFFHVIENCCNYTDAPRRIANAILPELAAEPTLFHGDGALEGKECHGIEFYYLMKPKNGQQVCSGSRTGVTTGNVEEYVRWIPIEELGNYKIFPEFFRDKLLDMPQEIEHIVADERVEK